MHYRLSFNAQLYERQCNALRNRIAQILERQDRESLTVLFSSEGGNTDQALSLYNFIRSLPLPIHMHAVGHVGSSAIPVFLGGHQRSCTTFSRFFFHSYDWGFEGRQMVDRIAEALQRLESDIALSRQIVERSTAIPPERLTVLYQKAVTPTIIYPPEAVDLGIVTEIVELGVQPNTAIWTVDWAIG